MAKKASKSSGSKYTKPQLRQKLKEKVQQDDKGGKKGQWSARKSQLLAQKYKAEGGGYEGDKGAPQKSIDKWTDEQWTTADGDKAQEGSKTDRYLPKEAWDEMTAAQKKATRTKKKVGSASGKQFVANTEEAKTARKKAVRKAASKKKAGKTVAKKTGKKASKKTAKKTTKKAAKKTSKKSPVTARSKVTKKKAAKKKTTPKKKSASKTVSRKKVGRPKKKQN